MWKVHKIKAKTQRARSFNASEMVDKMEKVVLCMLCDKPFLCHNFKHKNTQFLVIEMDEEEPK